MTSKIKRVAQDEVLSIVEQAIALERQRVDIIPDADLDEVGGGLQLPGKIDTGTMGYAPTDPPFPSWPDILGI